ncbi:Diphthamide biosynthesis protein 4 [Hypsizygus marmoreus]|uniref:Diphthamide biosynthesis protein 4 n=1 Tax=Hypsizygus marmoreus TaxID=39966 RepID=A0A369KAX9_HYPMA|nr:Diphthamide biosynthesis protein 4 [Hypsizygus marmoreus]
MGCVGDPFSDVHEDQEQDEDGQEEQDGDEQDRKNHRMRLRLSLKVRQQQVPGRGSDDCVWCASSLRRQQEPLDALLSVFFRFYKLASSGQALDFYQLLSIPRNASSAEIKIAYHRALLQFHPDKKANTSRQPAFTESISITLIKEAYITLSSPDLRSRYDVSTRQKSLSSGPRPAQIISLEEFEELGEDSSEDDGVWRKASTSWDAAAARKWCGWGTRSKARKTKMMMVEEMEWMEMG